MEGKLRQEKTPSNQTDMFLPKCLQYNKVILAFRKAHTRRPREGAVARSALHPEGRLQRDVRMTGHGSYRTHVSVLSSISAAPMRDESIALLFKGL